MTAVETSGGLGGSGVGTAAGLGEAEGAQRGSTGERRQPLLLLGLGAEAVDRHCPEGYSALQCDGHTLVDLAEFFQRQTQGEVVATHAAVLLRERQSEQTHLGHPSDNLVRERVLGIVFGGDRGDDLTREVPNCLRQLLVLVGKGCGR